MGESLKQTERQGTPRWIQEARRLHGSSAGGKSERSDINLCVHVCCEVKQVSNLLV